MHLVHRTIPFIAIAALVTVSSAGAQERDDSTSTAGGVGSQLGLGGRFGGSGSGRDDGSPVNVWNCAGGCAAFGARRSGNPYFGLSVATQRSPAYSAVGEARSVRMPTELADLSDYGWSRRVGTDGVPLAPLRAARVLSADPDGAAPTADVSAVVPLAPPASDGAGQAPRWVAPGSSSGEVGAAWNVAPEDQIAVPLMSRSTAPWQLLDPDEALTALEQSLDNVAPLVTTVPEPSSMVLLAVGMGSLLFLRRRSTRRR